MSDLCGFLPQARVLKGRPRTELLYGVREGRCTAAVPVALMGPRVSVASLEKYHLVSGEVEGQGFEPCRVVLCCVFFF